MAKRKKKSVEKIKKPVEVKKEDGIGLDSYFVIRQIKPHKQAGMSAYNGASELGLKTLKEWDLFFALY